MATKAEALLGLSPKIAFGKHAGKTYDAVIKGFFDYHEWMHEQAGGAAKNAALAIDKRIALIDALPWKDNCANHSKCGNRASRLSLYYNHGARSASDLVYRWCSTCNEYSSGAMSGTLTAVDDYRSVRLFCRRNQLSKAESKTLIAAYLRAKGL